MAGQKRSFKEVDSFDSICAPISSANVHGVVTSLSPVKKGKKSVYFDGTVSDGASKIRLVGFTSKQRKVMEEYMAKRQPVKLSDCEIKQARRGDQMEVLLKGKTSIEQSPKQIEVQSVEFETTQPTRATLYELQSIEDRKRVTVTAKVLEVGEIETVSTGRSKQDVIIADAQGTMKVTLWEEHIGKLNNDVSYTLENFVVREWDSKKYLSVSRDSVISNIDDIGDVQAYESDEALHEVKNAQIIAVSNLNKYKACLRCKARVEPSALEGYGRCSRPECIMMQKLEFCTDQLSVKLLMVVDDKMYALSAFGKVVTELAGAADVTDEQLLLLPPLQSVTFNDGNIIVSFQK